MSSLIELSTQTIFLGLRSKNQLIVVNTIDFRPLVLQINGDVYQKKVSNNTYHPYYNFYIPRPQWKGDNYCDDENNHPGCEYDGGDCCGDNVNTQYCSACECLEQ